MVWLIILMCFYTHQSYQNFLGGVGVLYDQAMYEA